MKIVSCYPLLKQFFDLYVKEEFKLRKLLRESEDDIVTNLMAYSLLYYEVVMPLWNKASGSMAPNDFSELFNKTITTLEKISVSPTPLRTFEDITNSEYNFLQGFSDVLEVSKKSEVRMKKLDEKIKEMSEGLALREST
jgi:hypothetical protein